MNSSPHTPKNNLESLSFEDAYKKLEEILDRLNSGAITLDDSLIYYEEADKLITICQELLNKAEHKIEILVKNRQGELLTGQNGRPQTQDFKV